MTTSTPRSVHPAGARALYLAGGERKRVAHTGEALVVTNASQQIQRYPLVRLSRIVSSPMVDWDGGALALCLSRGISITWLDGKGHALGSALPNQHQTLELAQALELMLQEASGHTRYTNWLRSRRMAVLAQWGKAHASAKTIQPWQWEATKRQWVYANQVPQHLPTPLRGHCHAWVAAQLAQHRLPAQFWGPQAEPVDICHDLTQLLWAQINLHTGTLADAVHTERELTDLFERLHTAHGGSLHVHLASLLRAAQTQEDNP